MMYCKKYSCRMAERACIARQKKAAAGGTNQWGFGGSRGKGDPGCLDCEQGKKVAAEFDSNKKETWEEMEMAKKSETAGDVGAGNGQGESGAAAAATKKCQKCGETKPLAAFHKHASTKDGRETTCKACKVLRAKDLRKAKKATGRTAKPAKEQAGKPSSASQKAPVTDAMPEVRDAWLMVDFSRHPKLLEQLKAAAEDELRTPEAQLLWWVKDTIAFNAVQSRVVNFATQEGA